MEWRKWLYETVKAIPGVNDLAPGGVHAAGSLKGTPDEKPFIVLRMGVQQSALNDSDAPLVTNQEAIVYVHDQAGTYTRIDNILSIVRTTLVGQVSEETAVACTWQGDSGELSDEFYRTITRNGSFRLIGRVS